MAALTVNKEVVSKENGLLSAPIAVDIIYKGALCKYNAAGYLAPCATEAGAYFAGIAAEKVDNASGDAGDEECRIFTNGVHLLTGSGLAQSDVGSVVYASDDQTITTTDSGNLQVVGKIVAYVSATQVWVEIVGAGIYAIADGSVTEAKLEVPTNDGLGAKRVARATYDFSVDGGSVGAIALGVTLPDNAVMTRSWYDVVTGMTSAGGAGTIAFHAQTANDILSAVDADTLSGQGEGIQDGTAANMVKLTAARELTATIAVEALTAGKVVLFVEYVVSA